MAVEMPSYIAAAKFDQSLSLVELHHDSIVIKDDDDIDFLIGRDAREQTWNSTRLFGGDLSVPQYKNLLRGLIARTLGEGEHNVTIALAVSHNWVNNFRESPSSTFMSLDNENILREALSSILFRTQINREWQQCRVHILDRPFVYHELAAVSHVIPREKYRNYVLWQLGHGDLQQVVFVDGMPVPDTVLRTDGIAYAIKKLGELLKMQSTALADVAWRQQKFSAEGEMNGVLAECLNEKRKAIKAYFYESVLGKLINPIQQYAQRACNIILSGGGAKDAIVVGVLRQELESLGFKFWPINDLPKSESLNDSVKRRLSDPLFTCVEGLCTKASLGIDVGNSALKSKWENQ